MKYDIRKLVDIPRLQGLLDAFYAVTAVHAAVIDAGGEILSTSGWQKICREFHLRHPEVARTCLETRIQLNGSTGAAPAMHRCPQGLVDVSVPIVIAGEHVASMIAGQVFMEPPDGAKEQFFREQAHRYGFHEADYMAAFRAVPVISQEAFHTKLSFLATLANFVGEMGLLRFGELKALAASRDREAKILGIFRAAPAGIGVVRNRVLQEVNPRLCEMTGYSQAELVGSSARMLYLSDADYEYVGQEKYRQISASGTGTVETRFRGKDGRIIHVVLSSTPVDLSDLSAGVVFTATDITERKQGEAERERLMSAIEQSHEAIVVTGTDGAIQYVNPAFEKTTGYTKAEAIGQNPRILKSGVQDESFYRDLWETITSGRTWTGRMVNRRKDGMFFTEDASISPVRDGDDAIVNFVGVKRDITRELETEKRLIQSQRIEAIGALAGGIAHDFNNLLFPISGMAEMLLDDFPSGTESHENVEEILKAARRAGDLVRQILTFSRQDAFQKVPILIQNILKEVAKLTRATIPASIALRFDIQQDCGPVMADPSHIHQIAMNLITNAYHAVEESDGRIQVVLEEAVLADCQVGQLPAGSYAVLSVSDTGHGIPPGVMDKIFEPYFTTKPQGKGTGMGLSTVYGIVKEHGGDIRVESTPGQGTAFTVYLPMMPMVAEPFFSDPVFEDPMGSERVLLVEDDEAVARLVDQMLERLGYAVTFRTSSMDALALFRVDPMRFDLVITDMTMPNMTGDRLAREVMAVRPGIPVIMCTGFSEKMNEAKARAIGVRGFLPKPVLKSDLAHMVRRLLDEAKSEG